MLAAKCSESARRRVTERPASGSSWAFMAHFSERSRIANAPNALTSALEARVRACAPVLHLETSNPSEVGLAWDAELLARLIGQPGSACYTPSAFGLDSAREAIRGELLRSGFVVPREQIMLTASTSEAYGFLFKLLCDPGDSVLVPSPSYPLFDMLASMEGVELVPYQLAYDGEWHVDMASVRSSLRETTRAILLVHPNNPTGSFLKRDELFELSAFGLPLLSDEVFAEYAHVDDPRRASSALLAAEQSLVFRLGGLSKSLLLPQLKLAFTCVAGPKAAVDVATERLSHIADTYLSVATPVQLALPELLLHGGFVRAKAHARILHNLRVLQRACEGSALSVLHSEGGWYAILRLPAIHTDEAWALLLLEQEGVLTQPGFYYDLCHGAHLVLSLIVEETRFTTGVARILACVAREITRA